MRIYRRALGGGDGSGDGVWLTGKLTAGEPKSQPSEGCGLLRGVTFYEYLFGI